MKELPDFGQLRDPKKDYLYPQNWKDFLEKASVERNAVMPKAIPYIFIYKEKKAKKPMWPVFLILTVLVIYLAGTSISIPYFIQEPYRTNTTIEYNETYLSQEPERIENCENQSYIYTWAWRGWNDYGGENLISPILEITNHEIRSGVFTVQFSFYNETERPELIFGYELGFDEADYYSDVVSATILPDDYVRIDIPTIRPDSQRKYWARADIQAPSYERCYSYLETSNRTMARSYNTTEEVTRYRESSIRISLIDYLINRPSSQGLS